MCRCVISELIHDVIICVRVIHVQHAAVIQLLDGRHPIPQLNLHLC